MLTVDPLDNAIIIDRADDQELKITVTDSAGAALDVTGALFKLTVKGSIDDALVNAKFQKVSTTAGHFDLSQAASGIVVCNIAAADVAALAGEYIYDLEMTLGGKVRTLIPAALFVVRKDVSTDGAAPPAPSFPTVGFPAGLAIEGGALYFRTPVADGGDGLYHKFLMQSDGLGGFTLTDVGSGAGYPF